MKKRFQLLWATFLLLIPACCFAQSHMKIFGTVLDSTKPAGLITVRLYGKNKTLPLQSTLSNDKGNYTLNRPDTGSYTLMFSATGFSEKTVLVTIPPEKKDIQVEPVMLSPSIGSLKEIVVHSQRPLVEQSDDKIVFNAEDDPATKTETAIDILRRTPFITVDGDDNIKINGKSNFKVLLNGRETSMFARNVKEALRGFPGALISKIEVITTPSAKYDGEGIGGLINIITRKKLIGYNGTISSFNRTSDKVNNYAINGNAKMGNVGVSVFLNAGHSNPVVQHNSNATVPTVASIYTKRTLEGDQLTSSNWSFGNAELSWDIDTLNTISVYTNIDSYANKTASDQVITTELTSRPSVISNYHLTNESNNPGINIGSDYIKHSSKNKDREFSLRFLGEFGRNDSKLNSVQDYPERYLINNSYAKNTQYTIQADKSIPLKNAAKLEAGVKAIIRIASSDFQSLNKYAQSSDYKINPGNSDYFKYDQNVYSIYSMYNKRLKKSSFRIGHGSSIPMFMAILYLQILRLPIAILRCFPMPSIQIK